MTKTELLLKMVGMFFLALLLFIGGIFSSVIFSMGIRYPYLNIYIRNLSWIVPLFIGMTVFLRWFFMFRYKILGVSYLVMLILALVTGLSIRGYERNIEQIRLEERGIDLYRFRPFSESPDLARLENPASFSIDSELPRIDGATALYPIYAAFVEAVYPVDSYPPYPHDGGLVVSSKTCQAYERLIRGEVDIIFAGGPSEDQLAAAESYGVELTLTPIGAEAFVFFVNRDNLVDNLSLEQIIGIYSGEITDWNEVGGANQTIRPFQRPKGSGSQTALQNLMGDVPLMDPKTELVVGSMGGIITETADYRNHVNAIGYSFRYYSMTLVENDQIKHLSINGIHPSFESIADGSYPIAAPFYAITAGSTNPNIDDFIEWIRSSEGQALVEASGYVPLEPLD